VADSNQRQKGKVNKVIKKAAGKVRVQMSNAIPAPFNRVRKPIARSSQFSTRHITGWWFDQSKEFTEFLESD